MHGIKHVGVTVKEMQYLHKYTIISSQLILSPFHLVLYFTLYIEIDLSVCLSIYLPTRPPACKETLQLFVCHL